MPIVINGEALIKGQGVKNLPFITEKTAEDFFSNLYMKNSNNGKRVETFAEINYTDWYTRLLGSICQIKLVESTGF